MDELTQTLLQRQMQDKPNTPNVPNRVPPAWKRYATAEAMQDAYRNDWEPNPILLGVLRGN